MADAPEGFALSQRSSAFLDLIGPIWEAGPVDDYRLGIRIGDKHVNNRGFCHGGVIASLADVSLGRIIAISEEPRLNIITMNVSVDYLSAARIGQWLEASGRVDRVGKRVAHSSGLITADGELVARATGVFMRYPRET